MSIFTDMLPATLLVNKTKKGKSGAKTDDYVPIRGYHGGCLQKQQLQKYKHGQIPGQYAQRHHDV